MHELIGSHELYWNPSIMLECWHELKVVYELWKGNLLGYECFYEIYVHVLKTLWESVNDYDNVILFIEKTLS